MRGVVAPLCGVAIEGDVLVDVVEPGLAVEDVVNFATVESEPRAASANVTAPSKQTRRAIRTGMGTALSS